MDELTMRYLWLRSQAEPWAIWPEALKDMMARLAAADAPLGQVDERLAVSKPGPKSGRLAQVSIIGSISRRRSLWSDFFGGASVEGLSQVLRDVAADDSIGTVLLNIDSPGGSVDGLPELAAQIRQLRESKHVVALANSLSASAAYWIASQADEIIATPEALVGSVGVFMMHADWSKFMDSIGIKYTYIFAGKYKVEGNPDEPLSDEARSHLQSIVNAAYDLFVADVAKGRNVSAAMVRSDYGEGRVLTAKEAKAAGLIDRVAGYNETVARLGGMKAEGMGIGDQGLVPSPNPFPQGEGQPSPQPSPNGEGASVGNSLAAKRLRLELLEKS
jgi:signal peptide peptidase SppA